MAENWNQKASKQQYETVMPLFRVHRDREHVINPRPDRGPCMHAPGQQHSARFARRLAAACLLVPKRHSELFGRQEVFVSVGAAQTSMGTTSQSDRAASGRRAGAARKKKQKTTQTWMEENVCETVGCSARCLSLRSVRATPALAPIVSDNNVSCLGLVAAPRSLPWQHIIRVDVFYNT